MIFLVGNTSGNSDMKSEVSELALAPKLVLLAFLLISVTPFVGKVIMAFPQSIIAQGAVR